MPLNLKQIKNLHHFSTSNFRKFECDECKNEFYSIRQCKYCCSACKQNAYRSRLLSEEPQSKEKEQEKTSNEKSSLDSKKILDLKERMKEYEQKTKSINK